MHVFSLVARFMNHVLSQDNISLFAIFLAIITEKLYKNNLYSH